MFEVLHHKGAEGNGSFGLLRKQRGSYYYRCFTTKEQKFFEG